MIRGEYTFYIFRCRDEFVKSTYIGQTVDFERRKKAHERTYRLIVNGKIENNKMKLYSTIQATGGFNNWVCVPIETAQLTPREADQRERYWIESLKATLNYAKPYYTDEEFYMKSVRKWVDPKYDDTDRDSVNTLEEFHALKVAKREVGYERRETALVSKFTRPLVNRAIFQVKCRERTEMRIKRHHLREWAKLIDQERRKVIRSIVRRWIKQIRDPAKGLVLDI